MKPLKRAGKIIKPFVNFPKWLSLGELKRNNQFIYGTAKDIIKPELSPVSQETFEEAMVRLRLTEQDVVNRRAFFLRMTFIYGICAVALLIYSVYLLVSGGNFLPMIMALSLMFAALALCFKQHFWYTQMKQRRLGLTFDDWFQYTFKRGHVHE